MGEWVLLLNSEARLFGMGHDMDGTKDFCWVGNFWTDTPGGQVGKIQTENIKIYEGRPTLHLSVCHSYKAAGETPKKKEI